MYRNSFFIMVLSLGFFFTSCSDEAKVFEKPQSKPQVTNNYPSLSVGSTAYKGDDLQEVPVRGNVRDRSENPISNAEIRLTSGTDPNLTYYDSTDTNGLYQWVKVQVGPYYRSVLANGYESYLDTILIDDPDTTQVINLELE